MSKNTHSWYCPVYNDNGVISGWQDTLCDALRRGNNSNYRLVHATRETPSFRLARTRVW
jgi:hypothetical protein